MAHSAPRFFAPRLPAATVAPRSRRAAGVYYTPPDIVRLIVDLTLGPLLDDAPARSLQILDPACGAGEFLVEAQRQLLRARGDVRATGWSALISIPRRSLPPAGDSSKCVGAPFAKVCELATLSLLRHSLPRRSM